MFEKYTAMARRVVFLARYEASQVESPYIETEHLLLGLFREDKALANRFLRSHAAVESIRKQIEQHTTPRDKVSTSLDLSLSQESKRVLSYGAEEAERLDHKHIGTEHILLGLLREDKCFAAEILYERGLRLSTVREAIARSGAATTAGTAQGKLLSDYGRDLAGSGENQTANRPAFHCQQDIDRIIEILCRRACNNPVVSGDSEAVEAALHSLAQRIADANVPPDLQQTSVVAVDLLRIEAVTGNVAEYRGLLRRLMTEVEGTRVLVVFENLSALLSPLSDDGGIDVADVLCPALMARTMCCVVADTGGHYRSLVQKHPLLSRLLSPISLTPPAKRTVSGSSWSIRGESRAFTS